MRKHAWVVLAGVLAAGCGSGEGGPSDAADDAIVAPDLGTDEAGPGDPDVPWPPPWDLVEPPDATADGDEDDGAAGDAVDPDAEWAAYCAGLAGRAGDLWSRCPLPAEALAGYGAAACAALATMEEREPARCVWECVLAMGSCADARYAMDSCVCAARCAVPCDRTCAEGTFDCGDGYCLQALRECDGLPDCADRSDEHEGCGALCAAEGGFVCGDDVCIPAVFECDGYADCADGTDEHEGCLAGCIASGGFECEGGWCLPPGFRCDGIEDCPTAEDEWGCENSPCRPNPCHEPHRSVCEAAEGVAVCACDWGFRLYGDPPGGACLPVDPCAGHTGCADLHRPCANAAGVATCGACLPGWHDGVAGATGACEEDTQCGATTCAGHGACEEGDGGPVCTCDEGYAGGRCEACDEAAGFHRNAAGDACTGDPCDPDPCVGGPACADTCDPADGRCKAPAGRACDDGVFCNGPDACDGEGVCVRAGDPCRGGGPCNDRCDELSDSCAVPGGEACDDGAFCNGSDLCDGLGACVHDGDPCPAGDACAACDEDRDACLSPEGTACGDGVFCNGKDLCDGEGGCRHAGDPCPAHDPCARCDEALDRCRSPAGTPCDDAVFCNGAEACDDAGACASPGDPCAGTGDPCRALCDEREDTCYAPPETACDDGDPATLRDACVEGRCVGDRCGNGTVDEGEECDAGVDNGTACDPAGLDACDWCTTGCRARTLSSAIVRGVVFDATRPGLVPVAGARVSAPGAVPAVTDAGGAFRLVGIGSDGPVLVAVEAPGEVPLEGDPPSVASGYSTARVPVTVRVGVETEVNPRLVQGCLSGPVGEGEGVTLSHASDGAVESGSCGFLRGSAAASLPACEVPIVTGPPGWDGSWRLSLAEVPGGDLAARLALPGTPVGVRADGTRVRLQVEVAAELRAVASDGSGVPLELDAAAAALCGGAFVGGFSWPDPGLGWYALDPVTGTFVEHPADTEWWTFSLPVDAFGWWVVARPLGATQCLTGTLAQDGAPVAWTEVVARHPYGLGLARAVTDDAGRFRLEVPAGAETVSVEAVRVVDGRRYVARAEPAEFAVPPRCTELGTVPLVPRSLRCVKVALRGDFDFYQGSFGTRWVSLHASDGPDGGGFRGRQWAVDSDGYSRFCVALPRVAGDWAVTLDQEGYGNCSWEPCFCRASDTGWIRLEEDEEPEDDPGEPDCGGEDCELVEVDFYCGS